MKFAAFLAILVLVSTGCGEDLGFGPEIVSMTVSPDTLSTTETGMTDQFFTITIEVSGFTDEIDVEATRAFIQPDEVDAVYESATLVGNTITLDRIATGWFQTLPPGTYDIGAEVSTVPGDNGQPTEAVERLNLTTVTITE